MVNSVAHKLANPVVVELPDYAVLDARGADALSFLKLQFCNDLAETTATHAQLSGYCNPKGRLFALFTVFAIEEGYRLVLHRDLLEATSKRLQMLSSLPPRSESPSGKLVFAPRADVTIDVRDDLLCTGVVVPPGESLNLEGVDVPALPQVMDVHTNDAGNWVQISGTQTLLITASNTQQSWMNAGIEKADANVWRLHTILAGVPSLYATTVDKFVPQMINMQQLGGLSFTHGCYPGQEIVARMQYLGKLKRQMLRFEIDGSEAPPAGALITTGDDTEAGVVIDAVATDKGVQLLAVMKLASINEPLSVEGQPLIQQSLPYELASESS